MVNAIPVRRWGSSNSPLAIACSELAAAVVPAPDAFARSDARALGEELFAIRTFRHVRSMAYDLGLSFMDDRILLEFDHGSFDAGGARRLLGGLMETVEEIFRAPDRRVETFGRWE